MEAKDVRPLMEALASVYEGYGKKKKGDCVSKSEKGEHNCAKKVCHEQFGEGTCIFGEHAVPDENGFVSHYDVLFEHGIEVDVPVNEMEVLEEGSHNEENHWYEGEQISEGPEEYAGGQHPSKSPNKKDRDRYETQRRRAEAPKGVGVPDKSVGYGGLKDDVDLFDLVKGYLLDEGHADTEEDAMYIMANMTEESRNEILDFIESMASASRMKEIKEKGFERPARSREFEKRLPAERESRGREFEHGSTRSANTPSENLYRNRGGGKGRERSHQGRNLADKHPRDSKGNLMY